MKSVPGHISRRVLTISLLTAISSFTFSPALAEETILITASPPDPAGLSVFSQAQITATDLQNVQQLDKALGQIPGVSLFRRNSSLSANPTTQGVSLRSIAPSGAGRALVTLDGVPQNDPFGGWVIWSGQPASAISSVTVLRGAGAGPYGAGALTGVIALSERIDTARLAGASWGERQNTHLSASGGTSLGKIDLFAAAALHSSAGWIPLSPSQRGPADDPVTLNARALTLRAQSQLPANILLSARMGLYDEARHAGLKGAQSRATGRHASLTLAQPQTENAYGWRLQLWLRQSDLYNSSVSVAADRATTTPANIQYATPALGWGGTAALRGGGDLLSWELGFDARFASGTSKELFAYSGTDFTQKRFAGGRSFVGGLYGEATSQWDNWLFTLGLRADHWSSSSGRLRNFLRASDALTLDQTYPSRSGIIPTMRSGLKYTVADELTLRAAAYTGFRAPSLNELYRPFRVGNVSTAANADLKPEQFHGAEFGMGGQVGDLSWSAGLFVNQLRAAITNVSIAPNSQQRRNVGHIDATGLEVEAALPLFEHSRLRAAFNHVMAKVNGRQDAPQLTGFRPAQSPRFTATLGLDLALDDRLKVSGDLRHESTRFADDQNRFALKPATTLDLHLAYRLRDDLSAFIAADNLFNADVATTAAAGVLAPIVSYDAPRLIRIGLNLAQ